MKKNYTMMGVAMAIAMSATVGNAAINRELQNAGVMENVQMKESKMKAPARAPKKAITAADVEGTYAWEAVWALQNHSGWNYGCVEINKQSATEVSLDYITFYPIIAKVDGANSKLVIENATLGIYNPDPTCTVYVQHYVWNEAGDGLDEVSTPFEIGYEDGVFRFDGENDRNVLGVTVKDASGELLGYYNLCYWNTLLKYPTNPSMDGWVDCGEASFQDGWLATAFGYTGTWDVKVQKSTTTNGLIRLYNPYENAPQDMLAYSNSKIGGSIEIDILDPNCVMGVPSIMAPSGFQWEDDGMTYCFTSAGDLFYLNNDPEEPLTRQDLIDGLAKEELGNLNNTIATLYDCKVGAGILGYALIGDSWADQNGNAIEMTTVLDLPKEALTAVSEIEYSDAHAPVEYYNMQGVKVANPEKGEIVIKRQGSKSVKMIAE